MKQIMTDKMLTPREGISVRSGLNSSRRQYEQQHHKDDEHDQVSSNQSEKINELTQPPNLPKKEVTPQELLGRPDNEPEDKSDIDALVSVETPKIGSEGNSSFNNTKKIKFDPEMLKDKLSEESFEPKVDDLKPLNLDTRIKDDPSADKSSSSEPSQLVKGDPSSQSLTRKKSEQHLKDISPGLKRDVDLGDQYNDEKDSTTPQPNKSSILSPFNSDNFFTQNFDDQEMEAAIEQLKNSSGKMVKTDISDTKNNLIDTRDNTKILKV